IRTFGAIIGNTGGNPRAVVLPAPMDFETDIMEASFSFANSQYQFGFSMYASWFDNGQKSVTWDNPFGQRSGWAPGVGFPDGQGLYSLEPDNEAMQFRAYGSVNLENNSRLSADFAFGSMEQDDPLFAYSVNPALTVHTPLPRTRMDAKIDTTFAKLMYTAQPTNKVSVLASYTLDDRDNKTARDYWPYIGGDSQHQKDEDDARVNLPYSYEKKQLNLNATWRASKGVRVKAGVENRDYTRTYAEVLGSDETKLFAGITVRKWENASLSFDYATSERDIDGYQGNRTLILSHVPGHTDPDDFENLPALRKFNQTDRERDEYRFRADFFPADNVNFGVSSSWFEDDFNDTDNLFGLQESEVSTWSLDAGFYPRDGVSITAYYTNESYDSLQTNRDWVGFNPASAFDAELDWQMIARDEVDTWNVALNLDGLGEKLGSNGIAEFGIDYTYSNVESDLSLTGASKINASPLPTLQSKMQSWSVFGKFEINDNSAIRLSYEMAKLTTRDFALDDVPIDGPSNTLLLGNTSPNYDLSLIMLSYLYRY
ncbi:MAG: MtrB/PioB family decaheme-associated outer membrane protein, partial [Gammaproteobacteria bacterium]